jgi:hypothetical protein
MVSVNEDNTMTKFLLPPKAWLMFTPLGLMVVLVAPLGTGGQIRAQPVRALAEPITYSGAFTLVQRDGSGCNFADAPLTSGNITLNGDWLAGAANGTLQGGGGGVRPGLRCGDTTGDMHWQQAYSANFSGSADSTSGAVDLTGSLSGSNNVSWQNCKENGEPITCPAGYSGPYTFPIVLQGTINTVGGVGNGTWKVNNIPLTTSGDWNVTGPALTPTSTPTDTPTETATPTATPTATSTPRIDLTVKNVEPVQVVQCLEQGEGDTTCPDNSVPLVSYKQTAVRVYVRLGNTPQEPVDGVTARLRGFRNNQEFADSPLTPVNDRIRALNVPDRGATNDTLNFRLPHDWLTGEVEIEIEVNPNQSLPEQNYQNNKLRRTLTFVDRPVFRMAYLPITYLGAMPTAIHDKFIFLYKAFPVGYGRLIYEPWPGFEWGQRISRDNATDLLAELKRRYLLAGQPVDQLTGWLPNGQNVNPLGKSDPAHFFGCWSNCGRVTWIHEEFYGGHILAHELSHNLGRRHTDKEDSCGAEDPGTDWPYATSAIQEYGFDAWTMQVVRNDENDLMTACLPKWLSPFTYKKLLEGELQPIQRRLAQAQPYLLISGAFYRAGGGELQPAYHFTSTQPVDLASTGNDGCLVLQDADTQTLAEHCFALEFGDYETGEEMAQISFVMALPDPGGVSQIRLKRNAADVDSLAASAHAPVLTLTTPTSGEHWSDRESITWQASDEDGDALTYAVLYSPDNGASWLTLATSLTQTQYSVNSQELAGGASAVVRVIASDGFHTSVADSPTFQVARKGPQPFILTPEAESELARRQSLLLSGEGYDLEDDLLPDDHFQWHSDQDGDLGQGRALSVALVTLGQHRLTLTATDSKGNTGAASVLITVRAPQLSLFLPLVWRAP